MDTIDDKLNFINDAKKTNIAIHSESDSGKVMCILQSLKNTVSMIFIRILFFEGWLLYLFNSS